MSCSPFLPVIVCGRIAHTRQTGTVGIFSHCGYEPHIRSLSQALCVRQHLVDGLVLTSVAASLTVGPVDLIHTTPCCCYCFWQGMMGSNHRMPESKSGALPLGESPTDLRFWQAEITPCPQTPRALWSTLRALFLSTSTGPKHRYPSPLAASPFRVRQ